MDFQPHPEKKNFADGVLLTETSRTGNDAGSVLPVTTARTRPHFGGPSRSLRVEPNRSGRTAGSVPGESLAERVKTRRPGGLKSGPSLVDPNQLLNLRRRPLRLGLQTNRRRCRPKHLAWYQLSSRPSR